MFKFFQAVVREVILTIFPRRCFQSTVHIGDDEPFWSVKETNYELLRYLGDNWYIKIM